LIQLERYENNQSFLILSSKLHIAFKLNFFTDNIYALGPKCC